MTNDDLKRIVDKYWFCYCHPHGKDLPISKGARCDYCRDPETVLSLPEKQKLAATQRPKLRLVWNASTGDKTDE